MRMHLHVSRKGLNNTGVTLILIISPNSHCKSNLRTRHVSTRQSPSLSRRRFDVIMALSLPRVYAAM